jgi:hypothetical protein
LDEHFPGPSYLPVQQYAGSLYLAQAEKHGLKDGRFTSLSGYGYTPAPGPWGGETCRSQGHQEETVEAEGELKGSLLEEFVPRCMSEEVV